MGNLIGVHGLDNKPSKAELESAWKMALLEGLSRRPEFRKNLSLSIHYWADLFHASPLLKEREPYTRGRQTIPPIEAISAIQSGEQLHELTPWEMGRRYPDLLRYYREPELGRSTRSRLQFLLEQQEGRHLMLISHSMGCLIAYDVLARMAPCELSIEMVTVGCPLGFPQLRKRMLDEYGELVVPRGVGSWTNYIDLRDPVATQGLGDIFAPGERQIQIVDRIVHNDYENPAGDANPHKVYGYLRSAALAEQTVQFLNRDPGRLSNRV